MTRLRPIALVRDVSPSIVRCELTHLAREPIDFGRAADQHREYTTLLEQLGCELHWVEPEPELPDAVFVEDTAVVVDEVAVATRPGALSRQAEVGTVAAALAPYRAVAAIEPPGTLDGGDVLRLNRTVYVGRSARTNEAGIAQLARHLNAFGYEVRPVETRGCLHLKSAATEVAEGLLLVNPAWIEPEAFSASEVVRVDPAEPYAANALRLGDAVIHAAAWVRTRERLEKRGIRVLPVDASELAKAEAGVTCCSVIFHRNEAA
jgi:dimethylargininase